MIFHILHPMILLPEIRTAIILFSERKDHCVGSCFNILKAWYLEYGNVQLTIGRVLKGTIVPKP